MTDRLEAIGVVIPARDEADRVDRCLAAVAESVRELRRSPARGSQIHRLHRDSRT